nr:MAG TPA: 60S ribosomal subunit [Caudoviricetes sp.]
MLKTHGVCFSCGFDAFIVPKYALGVCGLPMKAIVLRSI